MKIKNKKVNFCKQKFPCFPKMNIGEKASILHQVIMHLVIIGVLFALFFLATAGRVDSREVRQQVLEKQLALLIDSGLPGMSFSVSKINRDGFVTRIETLDGEIFSYVDGSKFSEGYPYFSKYNVRIEENELEFLIKIER